MNENAGASFSMRSDSTASTVKPAQFASNLLKPHPAPSRELPKEPLQEVMTQEIDTDYKFQRLKPSVPAELHCREEEDHPMEEEEEEAPPRLQEPEEKYKAEVVRALHCKERFVLNENCLG